MKIVYSDEHKFKNLNFERDKELVESISKISDSDLSACENKINLLLKVSKMVPAILNYYFSRKVEL